MGAAIDSGGIGTLIPRADAEELSPVISDQHLIYDPVAAAGDRILPVKEIRPQELWDYLWPKEGTEHAQTVPASKFLETARASAHCAPADEWLTRLPAAGGTLSRCAAGSTARSIA